MSDRSQMTPLARSVVYFIQDDYSHVKIGFTTNLNSRFNAIQNGSSVDLSLIRVIDGGAITERWLHRRFSLYRGPGSISYHSDHRWSPRRIPQGFGVVRWNGDERGTLAEVREEPTHLWGRDNGLRMTYLRVGKKAAGRLLDGVEHNEMPS